VVRLGNKVIRLQLAETPEQLASLPLATIAPGSSARLPSMQEALTKLADPGMKTDNLSEWIQAFVGLLHSAAGSEEFYVKAARAIVDLVRLDSGRILIRVGPEWLEKAVQHKPKPSLLPEGGAPAWRPS